MKVKEKDLVIGDLYWMSKDKSDLFWYVGIDDGFYSFYPKINNSGYMKDVDGTIPFSRFPNCYPYEEV